MSIASGVTLMGRAHAEALMVSTCTISRPTGEFVQDPDTLVKVPEVVVVYSGKCQLKFPNTSGVVAQIPGTVIAKDDLLLKLPVDASGGVRTDDVAVMDTNPLDASVVGLKLRVTGPHHGTFTTARRLPVEEVS